MASTVRHLLTAAVLFAPAVASAYWWEDETEKLEDTARIWTPASLQWASDIHPAHPSTAWIQANVAPPARELWCDPAYAGTPGPLACDIHLDRLDTWAQGYLNVQTVPQSVFDTYVAECPSICW